jgi:DNA-binding MarR family transcriptional regulator
MQTTSPPRWLDEREQRVWRSLLEMHAALNARLARELQQETPLSMPDFAVLVQLTESADGRARVLELADALRWEKSRLSHHLARMQHRGLITREECLQDKRGAVVVVTPDGRAAIEAAAPLHVEGVRRYLFDLLTSEQIDALAEISATVNQRLAAEPASVG